MGVLIAGFSYLPIDIKQPLARQEKFCQKQILFWNWMRRK